MLEPWGAGQGSGHRQSFHRRVVVKAFIPNMAGKAQRLHLDYIERDGAGKDDKKEPSTKERTAIFR